MSKYFVIFLLLVVMLLGAGGGLAWVLMGGDEVPEEELDDGRPEPTPTRVILQAEDIVVEPGGDIEVDEIDVVTLDADPIQVFAVIRGSFVDGCSKFGQQFVKRSGDRFEVILPTIKDEDGDCNAAGERFEDSAELNVEGMPDGEYVVEIGGIEETFVLGEVELDPTPTPTPESDDVEEVDASEDAESVPTSEPESESDER